jgi:hypothetical protein
MPIKVGNEFAFKVQEVKMKKTMIAIASLLLAAGVLVADSTENNPGEAKYYDNAKVIRIKNVEGEGFVQRSYDEGDEEATPNLPLFEKDTVGTTAGRLGIYLGRLNYLRLDSDTQVQLLSIPQLRKTDLVARVEKGAVYLDIESLDNEKSIEIQTPDCGVFILDKGIYRINVDENSSTEVFVMEGIAEVAGQESSRNVRENQKIVMTRGNIEEKPYYFYASEKDDFDSWNEAQNREQGYARYGTARYLQSGYEDYEYEMSRSGRWSYMSEFNSYVWTPYYSNADWMPYANGRWVYNPFYGYVWTSYDTCGWFTHHYGRWQWNYTGGWYWIPAYHWSPAWVSWFGDSDYYGWCPLSWWNRPVVIINGHWNRDYDYHRGIPHHSRSTIIIRKNELTAVNALRAALNRNNFGSTDARTIAYRGTAPAERLAINKVSVINALGKTVVYKQNSIVSSERYKASTIADQVSHGSSIKTAVYKYNPPSDASNKYAPRIFRGRGAEKNAGPITGRYFPAKTSNESSATTRVSSSATSGSRDSSQSKTSVRDNTASSSSSSSSASDSVRAAKKKKDEAAYTALLQSENSAGFKSHALGSEGSQSGYSASSSVTTRATYHAFGSRTDSEASSSGNYPPAVAGHYSSAREAAAADPGPAADSYPSRSGSFADSAAATARSSYGSFSTASPDSHNYSSNTSRSYKSSSYDHASSTAVFGNRTSHSDNSSRASFSAPVRSSTRAIANRSSASASVAAVARKKR